MPGSRGARAGATVRLGDAACWSLLSALLGRAVLKGAALADEQRVAVIEVAVLAVGALLALVTALYLRRRRARVTPRLRAPYRRPRSPWWSEPALRWRCAIACRPSLRWSRS